MAAVNEGAAIAPEALLALLDKDRFPAYVSYVKKAKRLCLFMPVKNKGVTLAKLRQEMETFTNHVKELIKRYEKESKLVKSE